jgi:L-alanine-DL-glutamate epimerase-like enolase superfamily enzyme
MLNPRHKNLDLSITITHMDVVIKKFSIDTPVKTSFGTMTERPAVFVRIRDDQGTQGYGEIWCNFPACGATHRANLFNTEIAPRALGKKFKSPAEAFDQISDATHILAIQTGEFGPIAQCISGLDIALWDLVAKRHGIPLHKLLSDTSGLINVYASGINPQGVGDTIAELQDVGHSRFKLKIGFGRDTDVKNLQAAKDILLDGQELMVDVNQAWNIESALLELPAILQFNPRWIEEPLRKDAPINDWLAFKKACTTKVAGGENFATTQEFENAINDQWMDVLQPDTCKWGGITKCYEIARYANQAGKIYCPHSLGGGIALAASAHLLAASGPHVSGILEVDNNKNPLREDVFPISPIAGQISLSDCPGLGVDTDVLDDYFNKPDD